MEFYCTKKNDSVWYRLVSDNDENGKVHLVQINDMLNDTEEHKRISKMTFKRTYKKIDNPPIKLSVSDLSVEEDGTAKDDMWFIHEGTGGAVFVAKGEPTEFLLNDIFDPITKEQYEKIKAQADKTDEITNDNNEKQEDYPDDMLFFFSEHLNSIFSSKVPPDTKGYKQISKEDFLYFRKHDKFPDKATTAPQVEGDSWFPTREQKEWDLEPAQPNKSSMRMDRDNKLAEAQPFSPDPFYLRQSMVGTYLQCPKKFYETYEEGLNEESKYTRMGTAVHGVMEDYFIAIGEGKSVDVDQLFRDWWEKYGPTGLEDYIACKTMVSNYLDRTDKNPNIIALEYEFTTTINGIPVSGTIDRIDRVDENTIRIIDYKTNLRPFTDAELAESVQFQMYVLAVLQDEIKEQLGGFDTVVCTYEMLRLGYQQSIMFKPQELENFAEWLSIIWTKMLTGMDRKPTINKYCSFCSIKHKCATYKDIVNNDPIIDADSPIEEQAKELQMVKDKIKLLKSREDMINGNLKELISQSGGEVVIGDRVYKTSSSTRKSYPSHDVIRMLAMNGMSDKIGDMVSFSPTSINNLAKNDKVLGEKLFGLANVSYTSPSITSRKKKKGE
ncbi:putative DNA repair protein [Bacillus phage vB_BpsS-140]|nr:putative DNA repair protein [Bacillus phage vB_BpsS-140]